jgi:hypothetical protein
MGISHHEEATMEVRDQGQTILGSDEEQCTYPLLAACLMLVSCLTYSSILKIEARYSSEKMDDFQRAAHS